MTFTYRPPSFLSISDTRLKHEIDQQVSRIYSAHAVLDGTAIKGPTIGAGFACNSGQATVTGKQLGISTGLTAVQHVVASIASSTATNISVTAVVTPSNPATIDLYCWQPTSASVNTPIAATTAVTVKWVVTGTSTESQ